MNRSPGSEVGYDSVTTLPPWPPTNRLSILSGAAIISGGSNTGKKFNCCGLVSNQRSVLQCCFPWVFLIVGSLGTQNKCCVAGCKDRQCESSRFAYFLPNFVVNLQHCVSCLSVIAFSNEHNSFSFSNPAPIFHCLQAKGYWVSTSGIFGALNVFYFHILC